MRLSRARTPGEWAAFEALVREYAAALGIDLAFQDFAGELAALREEYGPPTGAAIPAYAGGETIGCVGVRGLHDDACEIKRMYVRPPFRGRGAGRALALEAILAAQRLGYERMRLDTLETMAEARALHRSLGFREIEPYRDNPHPARFMELALPDAAPR